MQIKKLEMRIKKVKSELVKIGDMRPGSLSQQYSACQKSGCKCVDPVKPEKHGPFYQLSYSHQGKSTTQFVRPQLVATVEKQLAAYKRFKAFSEQWVALALDLSKLKLEEAKTKLTASRPPKTR